MSKDLLTLLFICALALQTSAQIHPTDWIITAATDHGISLDNPLCKVVDNPLFSRYLFLDCVGAAMVVLLVTFLSTLKWLAKVFRSKTAMVQLLTPAFLSAIIFSTAVAVWWTLLSPPRSISILDSYISYFGDDGWFSQSSFLALRLSLIVLFSRLTIFVDFVIGVISFFAGNDLFKFVLSWFVIASITNSSLKDSLQSFQRFICVTGKSLFSLLLLPEAGSNPSCSEKRNVVIWAQALNNTTQNTSHRKFCDKKSKDVNSSFCDIENSNTRNSTIGCDGSVIWDDPQRMGTQSQTNSSSRTGESYIYRHTPSLANLGSVGEVPNALVHYYFVDVCYMLVHLSILKWSAFISNASSVSTLLSKIPIFRTHHG
jgi:hypothetical protein